MILTVDESKDPYSACDVSELVEDLVCGRDLVSSAHNNTPNLKQLPNTFKEINFFFQVSAVFTRGLMKRKAEASQV